VRRALAVLVVLMTTALLSSCAVPLPRGSSTVEKAAVRADEVPQILDRYQQVRAIAAKLLDPKPLSTVEAGSVLAIDSGTFEVEQRLAQDKDLPVSAPVLDEVHVPRVGAYPLWFVAVVSDKAAGVNRVQVFERASSVDPWLLVASPETLPDTELPGLRHDDGFVLAVRPDNAAGLSSSPAEAAKLYAEALDDPGSKAGATVADDGFITQMRDAAKANAGLDGVTFSQSWDVDDVEFVLRTDDGGALVFATLLRRDTYEVADGITVGWPGGSPQQAFLTGGISSSGELRFDHQVLLYLPGGGGPPRALGQYGGVVSADGS